LSMAFGWFLMTRARFLGFAAYVVAGGGSSTQNTILLCKAYLDSDPTLSSGRHLQCLSKVMELLFKAGASAIAGGFVEDAVREYFVESIAWARGM
jgi:hypothetical protein